MGIVLDVPTSLERERAVNAVRSPLSPLERYETDKAGYKRKYQDALLSDAESRKKAALKPDAGRDRTNPLLQFGIVLHSDLVIKRLKQLNNSLWFERANADHNLMGIYIRDERIQPEGRRYLTCFPIGPVPEYSILKKDSEGECTGVERKGWRAVLTRLLHERLITSVQAEIIFGPPSRDSELWAVFTGKRSRFET